MVATPERKQELEKTYGKNLLVRGIQEQETMGWMESNAQKCPNCCTLPSLSLFFSFVADFALFFALPASYVQKMSGCNKMHCSVCNGMFSSPCSVFLSFSQASHLFFCQLHFVTFVASIWKKGTHTTTSTRSRKTATTDSLMASMRKIDRKKKKRIKWSTKSWQWALGCLSTVALLHNCGRHRIGGN